ncbi:hypothetical protein MKW94_022965 [Papaver nudicaule]|uniref:PLATZ transcription factor family protein n=1 Tax=Papaver nudicaule TaxID=74823 RepID=A0AA42AZE1_PAPNU|nr:hypothetical protein [Papaver nudicaule]
MKEKNESSLGTTPEWLRPLLKAKYFKSCRDHRGKADLNKNSECNFFCLDCISAPICSYCLIHHTQHRILRIRRSWYHNVVRFNEVEKHIDISGVQHYVNNNSKIVFLNPRPLSRPMCKGVVCEICARSLLDSFRFCSLGCKLEGMKRVDQKLTFTFGIKNNRDAERKKQCKNRSIDNISSDGCNHCGENGVKDTPSIYSHRRKGIPHRAPF